MKNPLDGVTVNQPTRVGEHGLPKEASGMFQYFLKVGGCTRPLPPHDHTPALAGLSPCQQDMTRAHNS